MEDHRFIPEFSPSRVASAVVSPPAQLASPRTNPAAANHQPRRFRKGDAVAEILERNLRELHLIEWTLLLNGRVVTTRQFGAAERADYEHELHGVERDLAGSGWIEERHRVRPADAD